LIPSLVKKEGINLVHLKLFIVLGTDVLKILLLWNYLHLNCLPWHAPDFSPLTNKKLQYLWNFGSQQVVRLCHCRKYLIQKMAKYIFQIFEVGKPLCVHLFFLCVCYLMMLSYWCCMLIIVGRLMNTEQLIECELAGETEVLR
jgi:hypothetical protein